VAKCNPNLREGDFTPIILPLGYNNRSEMVDDLGFRRKIAVFTEPQPKAQDMKCYYWKRDGTLLLFIDSDKFRTAFGEQIEYPQSAVYSSSFTRTSFISLISVITIA